jgi:hypothetical protein
VLDFIEDQKFGYLDGQIIKYVSRYRHKNGLEDLKKAEFYLKRLIAEVCVITYTGSRIEPLSKFDGKYNATPNIIDIALGLSRMARFSGQTRRWWSVLLHSLVTYQLAYDHIHEVESEAELDRVLMIALLHDSHEAITADVPAFFKPVALKAWQIEVDQRFLGSLNLWPVSKIEQDFIKWVDDESLRAEALLVGPPTIMQHLSYPLSNTETIVKGVMAKYPDCASSEGLDSPAVREFLDIFAGLYRSVAKDTCDDTPSNQKDKK